MKSLKEQVAELEISKPRDFDPEELEPRGADEEIASGDDGAAGEYDGREHYEEVGKSKLRKPVQVALGRQYIGAAVSRDALEADDDDDPFAPLYHEDDEDPFARRDELESDGGSSIGVEDEMLGNGEVDEDEEIDSDEAFGDSDEERFKKFKFSGSKDKTTKEERDDSRVGMQNGHDKEEELALNDMGSEVSAGDFDAEMKDIDLQEDSEELSETESESSSEVLPANKSSSTSSANLKAMLSNETSTDRGKLKAALSNDAATVVSSLSTALNDDSRKGKAVKQQHQTFDRLLDARIKLQKGISASNDLPSSISNQEATNIIERAEEAALNLWSTIESLRLEIQYTSQPSKKRKALSPPTSSTPTVDLWDRIESLETSSLPHRRAVLNKWSLKTRPPSNPEAKSQLKTSGREDNHITPILDSYLTAHSDKEVAAASIPSKSSLHDTSDDISLSRPQTPAYDDTSFYNLLLRDLVASRSTLDPSNFIPSDLPTKLHPSGSAHKRAIVDTKASKGRKVRYTVHEKLQNFGAVEDRSTWTQAARNEFFGSLFGAQEGRGLNEDMDDEVNQEGGGDEALRLFRN